jgi:phosphonate metabolism protein PhnN/1,5-bisphosphokinase (PRPP-forming)
MSRRGVLFLVVGPSGAGKDSLIDGARRALGGDPRFRFPRRAITRPADAGGEDHEALSPAAFEAAQAAGAFALCWSAHGLRYGVPRAIEPDLAAGASVVVNVSRAILAEAAARFDPARVIHVTVPPEVLARRLAGRGRETPEDVAARLARAATALPDGPPVRTLANDGGLEDGVRRFVALLLAEAEAATRGADATA